MSENKYSVGHKHIIAMKNKTYYCGTQGVFANGIWSKDLFKSIFFTDTSNAEYHMGNFHIDNYKLYNVQTVEVFEKGKFPSRYVIKDIRNSYYKSKNGELAHPFYMKNVKFYESKKLAHKIVSTMEDPFRWSVVIIEIRGIPENPLFTQKELFNHID